MVVNREWSATLDTITPRRFNVQPMPPCPEAGHTSWASEDQVFTPEVRAQRLV